MNCYCSVLKKMELGDEKRLFLDLKYSDLCGI